MTSVSVWLVNACPRPSSSSRSSAKFSMMPLCTTATRPSQEVWGCAFASLGRPCVAQRVWPMPHVPARPSGSTRRASPLTLPLQCTTSSLPPCSTAIPAES